MAEHSAPAQWAHAELLYEQLMPGAIQLAYVLCGDKATAEDAAQDAFVKVFARASAHNNITHHRAYLHKAVVRQVSNNRRAWQRWRQRTEAHQRSSPTSAYDPDISQKVDLRAAVSALPHKQRTVIALTYLFDHNDATIHTITGWSPGSIRVTRSRALQQLRKAFQHDFCIR